MIYLQEKKEIVVHTLSSSKLLDNGVDGIDSGVVIPD
jgi:hypothetical protein